MKIRVVKKTPYRKGYEREIQIGEVHEVIGTETTIFHSKAYYFMVDDIRRMALDDDCIVVG